MKEAYDVVLDFIKDPRNVALEKPSLLDNITQKKFDSPDNNYKFLYVCRRIHNDMSYSACEHLLNNYLTTNYGNSVVNELLRGYLMEIVGSKSCDDDERAKKATDWLSRSGKEFDSSYVVEPRLDSKQRICVLDKEYFVTVVKQMSFGKGGEGRYKIQGLPLVKCMSKSSKAKVKYGSDVRFIKIIVNNIPLVGSLLVGFEVGDAESYSESSVVAHDIEAEAAVWVKIFDRLAEGFDNRPGTKTKKKPASQKLVSTAVSEIVLSNELFDKLCGIGIIRTCAPGSTVCALLETEG